MGKKDIFLSIIFIVISINIYILTYQFPQQTVALSPKVFPRFVSTCLFILSITLLIQGIAGVKKNSEQKKVQPMFYKVFILRLLLMILLAFFYTRILPLISYVLATPPFVAGAMLLFNEKRWIWIMSVSIITTVLLYVLFRIIFRVPLPRFDFF